MGEGGREGASWPLLCPQRTGMSLVSPAFDNSTSWNGNVLVSFVDLSMNDCTKGFRFISFYMKEKTI